MLFKIEMDSKILSTFNIRMKNIIQSLLFLCCLHLTCSVQAWGPIAHRAVALIAQVDLAPNARDQVTKILGSSTMADVANWADQVRGEGVQYRQAGWYHFEKIEDGVNYIDHLKAMNLDAFY